jgi:RNase P/RNase MRP subunit POP5
MENWLGQNELAQASPRLIKNLWDGRQKKGYLQCAPKYVDQVKMALALIKQIGDQRVIFQVIMVTGTIKSGKIKTNKGRTK